MISLLLLSSCYLYELKLFCYRKYSSPIFLRKNIFAILLSKNFSAIVFSKMILLLLLSPCYLFDKSYFVIAKFFCYVQIIFVSFLRRNYFAIFLIFCATFLSKNYFATSWEQKFLYPRKNYFAATKILLPLEKTTFLSKNIFATFLAKILLLPSWEKYLLLPFGAPHRIYLILKTFFLPPAFHQVSTKFFSKKIKMILADVTEHGNGRADLKIRRGEMNAVRMHHRCMRVRVYTHKIQAK